MSNPARLSVIGLVLTAAGMLLQIAAGSKLYPSLAGPIVLLVTGGIVALGSWRWTRFVAVVVPLSLGVGAIVAAAMNGQFVEQLINPGGAGIVLGSLLQVIGLIAAVVGGFGMLLGRRARN